MPGLVYAAGQADAVYPLAQLAPEITRRVWQNRRVQATAAARHPEQESRAK